MNPTEALSEFIQTFEASLDPRLWVTLVKEETAEMKEAHEQWLDAGQTPEMAEAFLKEVADVMYVTTAFHMLMEHGENLYRFLISDEEWRDWELTAIEANNALKVGAMVFGADTLGQAFERVHQSNMSKLGDDGQPVRRKVDGKILKGSNYQPPQLADLVQ